MNFHEYRFRPRPVPTLAALVALPLLSGLGLWQLDRAQQKERAAQQLAERRSQPPRELTGTLEPDDVEAFRKARVRGVFEPEGQIFIENRKQGNRTGYHVITPLRLTGSDIRVLVNRGWVPRPPQAGQLPPAPAPAEPVVVNGLMQVPSPPALTLGDPSNWDRVWPYFTVEAYAARASFPVLPLLLLQDPADTSGFVRQWRLKQPTPWMHIGYAIQWFAFALIALVVYLRLSLQRPGEAHA